MDKKEKTLQVMLKPKEAELIDRLRKVEHRSVSQFLRLLVLAQLKAQYPDAFRSAGLDNY